MTILIPMAGLGKRFSDVGYSVPKPLIPVSTDKFNIQVPMVVAAVSDLPCSTSEDVLFVSRSDLGDSQQIQSTIQGYIPNSRFLLLDAVTEGQACTCLAAEDLIDQDSELLIAGCDNGMRFDITKLDHLKQKSGAIVFTFRNHDFVNQNPNAYGWVLTNNDKVTGVSVKKKISDLPEKDHAIVATFWFKKSQYFFQAAKEMVQNNDRINNEFYVDQVITYLLKNKLNVSVFEIDHYLCWGTPNEYENYEKTVAYWKEFHRSR